MANAGGGASDRHQNPGWAGRSRHGPARGTRCHMRRRLRAKADVARMNMPFYTVGHSNRSLQDFIDLIAAAGVGFVVDIRKMPMSRANPQFNGDPLAEALHAQGIGYEHAAPLGGLRSRDWDVPFEVNALWRNRSFHNYADYALSPVFRDGLTVLLERGDTVRTTVMCSEAVWWRCHRRIVADYLIAQGRPVFHIMALDRQEPAVLTPGAVIGPDASITYPPEADESSLT